MKLFTLIRFAPCALILSGATFCLRVQAAPLKAAPDAALEGDRKISLALNRFAFGPRPGDLERVRQMGLGKWLDLQLAPETIDDSDVERKLAGLKTLQFPPARLMLAYEGDSPAIRRALDNGKNKRGKAKNQPAAADAPTATMPATMPATDGAADAMQEPLNARQQETLQRLSEAGIKPGASVEGVGELVNDKIVRASESKRQLREVLVDFWSNHFNQDVKKGLVRSLKIVDERDVIRPHVLGRFRDLLGASAKSPSMLFYLDNFRSTREYSAPARMRRAANANPPKRAKGGLNENYGRELMELHTLGVDGGYTQQDVTEVARCFTGWGINRETGTFEFKARAHDDGAKTVLGRNIPAGGGIRDGETVLDILASSSATAHHLAHELCLRFVSDEPSPALVERVAQKFLSTQGDLQAVMRVIAYAPETYSPQTYRAKIKSPFEFAVSAVRALGASVEVPDSERPMGRLRLVGDGAASMGRGGKGGGKGRQSSLAREIATMGQPLFGYQAPTGYAEDSREWVSSGALIARLNFALSLTGGQISNVPVDTTKLVEGVPAEDHQAVLNRLAQSLAGGDLSEGTRATLLKQMPAGTPADAAKLAALVLGSPEFQRR